jgi:glutathione S-transferase
MLLNWPADLTHCVFHDANRRMGMETNEERAKAGIATLEKTLDVYEQILSKQKYLVGDVSLRGHCL